MTSETEGSKPIYLIPETTETRSSSAIEPLRPYLDNEGDYDDLDEEDEPTLIPFPVFITFQTTTPKGVPISVYCKATAQLPFFVDGTTLTFSPDETADLAKQRKVVITDASSFLFTDTRDPSNDWVKVEDADPWTELTEGYLQQQRARSAQILKGVIDAELIKAMYSDPKKPYRTSGLILRDNPHDFVLPGNEQSVTVKNIGRAMVLFIPAEQHKAETQEPTPQNTFVKKFRAVRKILGDFFSQQRSEAQLNRADFLKLFPVLLTTKQVFDLPDADQAEKGYALQGVKKLESKKYPNAEETRKFLAAIAKNNLDDDAMYNPEKLAAFVEKFPTYLWQARDGIVR